MTGDRIELGIVERCDIVYNAIMDGLPVTHANSDVDIIFTDTTSATTCFSQHATPREKLAGRDYIKIVPVYTIDGWTKVD